MFLFCTKNSSLFKTHLLRLGRILRFFPVKIKIYKISLISLRYGCLWEERLINFIRFRAEKTTSFAKMSSIYSEKSL